MRNTRNKIVAEYVIKFSKSSKTSVARLLVKDHPTYFTSVESARHAIRYVTGNQGKRSRKLIKDKSMIEKKKNVNIWGLLDEKHNDYSPYIIPKSQRKIGVLSDLHIPYQDNRALTIALNKMLDDSVDTIILNGDIMDFYKKSRFAQDPTKDDIKYEFDATKSFLKSLRDNFPKALIVFKTGNHEDRWKTFLMYNAPELFKMNEFKLDVILELSSLGIIFVDDKRVIKAGKLNIIHGHEYPGTYSPVNPAKGYYSKAQTNIMAGHNHQSSEHISKDANDEISGGWSLGCLCELHPLYMPLNKWGHGFAIVDIEKDGSFIVHNKKIINGDIR